MKKLVIVGAGAFGREILSWSNDIQYRPWQMFGFLDGNPEALEGYNLPYPILGDPKTYQPSADEIYICSIGNCREKLETCNRLRALGAEFTNLIHPSAFISRDANIGTGCILFPNVYIATNATIGDDVAINVSSSVGHDSIVGNATTISGHCDITGSVTIGQAAFLATHAAIIPSIKIADFATVGAGSLVIRNVKSGITVFGVPAKEI